MEKNKIKIKGRLYKVKFIDCDNLYNGLTNTETKTIIINNNLNNETLFETVIHELIHSYFFECGLDEYCADEKLVTFLARHFFDLKKSFENIFKKIGLNNGGDK